MSLVAAMAQAQTPPANVPGLLTNAAPLATVAVGAVRHTLDVGNASLVAIAADAVTCHATTPTGCPAVPAIGALEDDSAPWSAARLDGRMLLVRNAGPGVLALVGGDAAAPAAWRFSRSTLVAAGDVVLLVYDASAQVWRVLGTTPAAESGR
ncbi:MAG TPA: hypothetical protein VFX12_03795 [Vicinamibacterales bacterium]|nr:hypothetical protein [Vicinamibacterales bacterium]